MILILEYSSGFAFVTSFLHVSYKSNSETVRCFGAFSHQLDSTAFPQLRETEGMKYERMKSLLSQITLICVVVAGMSEGSPSEL